MRLSGGSVWAWSPDCKHDRRKPRPPAALHTQDGVYDADEAAS